MSVPGRNTGMAALHHRRRRTSLHLYVPSNLAARVRPVARVPAPLASTVRRRMLRRILHSCMLPIAAAIGSPSPLWPPTKARCIRPCRRPRRRRTNVITPAHRGVGDGSRSQGRDRLSSSSSSSIGATCIRSGRGDCRERGGFLRAHHQIK